VRLITDAKEAFNGALSCNTAQAHEYLVNIGGGVFDCAVNELGLRVQHKDGTIQEEEPADFLSELAQMQAYLAKHDTENLSLVEKNGGFAIRLSDEDGRRARDGQIDQVREFVRKLALSNDELTFVTTDGFVDLYTARLNKGYDMGKQMARPPFRGTWALAFGDGFPDEARFAVVAEERLTSHNDTLDVLEWTALRKKSSGL
jgi:hypothetical protein